MHSKRPRVERVAAPRHGSAASAVQPQTSRNTIPYPVNELGPEPIWTMKPSHHQPPSSEVELTHTRPMPLPFAIDVVIGGRTHACLYCGHGQSKVVYKLMTLPAVLKFTAEQDHEPHVCQQLSLEYQRDPN